MQWDNGIGDEGCKALGEALKVNTSVQILRLVSVFVLFLFVFVLRVFCCCEESGRLTCAVQGGNLIGAEGGKALGEALKGRPWMQPPSGGLWDLVPCIGRTC